MDENLDGIAISPKKMEANRRNAQLSTGPKTEVGKKHSRLNALKHGVLASVLLITEGEDPEDAAEFEELLGGLYQDLGPVGRLEEMMVEKLAVCWWRQKRALQYEARKIYDESQSTYRLQRLEEFTLLTLPLDNALNRILRYEASIQRQLVHAINQLERMQRARKGELVPAPVSVHVSSDQ